MPPRYDALLRNGLVVDPVNGIEAVMDVAIRDGLIDRVEPAIDASARIERDLAGKVVMPGIVDMHVHLSPWIGGGPGHRMLALAGVTTALDMAGPIEGTRDIAARHGAGLTVACISMVRPGHTVDSANPESDELDAYLTHALTEGAVGLKILGGHFPLTQAASARVIETCAKRGAHAAFHAGTVESPSPTVATMTEACELAQGHPLQMPHVNSYCRGSVIEGQAAIEVLAQHPAIWSESYLAPFNGFSARCANGVPESNAAGRGLQMGGFEASRAGMEAAIAAGWMHVHHEVDGLVQLVTGAEGVAAWRAAETDTGASFMVNPPEPRMHLVTAKKADGSFAIDALATDGGGLPRNDIVERGLPLVRMSGLKIAEFVWKSSVVPARCMGLGATKGHLAPGSDGDVTVLDMDRLVPVMAFSNGRRIMEDGVLYPGRTRFVCMPAGVAAVRAAGLEPLVIEPGSTLPDRGGLKPAA